MTDFLKRFRARRVFQVADAGAGAGGGADTAPGAGADTIPGGGDDTAPAGGAGAGNWWEGDKFNDTHRQLLTAKGLTVDDPLEALAKITENYRHAESRLGASPDQLLTRPKKDEDMSEWLRKNGEVFGIPESAEKYELAKPEGWPKDQAWDAELEGKARALGHQLGLNGPQLQGMVNLYAENVAGMLQGAERDLQQSADQLRTELKKDWGDQYDARVALAQQAASALAEAAGLDSNALMNIAQVLKGSSGDANTLRLFAAVGQMMGEDNLPRLEGSGGGLGTTPAGARAELDAMLKPDSDYGKAMAAKRAGAPGAGAAYKALHERRMHLEKIVADAGK